jgi:hypothetical protein
MRKTQSAFGNIVKGLKGVESKLSLERRQVLDKIRGNYEKKSMFVVPSEIMPADRLHVVAQRRKVSQLDRIEKQEAKLAESVKQFDQIWRNRLWQHSNL